MCVWRGGVRGGGAGALAKAHSEEGTLVPSGLKAPAYLEDLAKILGQFSLETPREASSMGKAGQMTEEAGPGRVPVFSGIWSMSLQGTSLHFSVPSASVTSLCFC